MPPPTLFTVRPGLSVDGVARPALESGLLSLSVGSSVSGASSCEAVFGNWGVGGAPGFAYFDRTILDFGKAFAVDLGNPSMRVFNGRIMAIEGVFPDGSPPTIRITAEDHLNDLRMTRRTRTYEDCSDADVIQQVAGRHGLQSDVDISGPTYKQLSQVNQSDLAFLLERARAIDAEVWLDGDVLHAVAHVRRAGALVRLGYPATLQEFSVVADLRHQRTRVRVGGWDVSGKAALTSEAGEGAVAGELAGAVSGAAVLQHAIGDRTDTIAHESVTTGEEARMLAESSFRALARRFVVGRGTAPGAPGVRPGGRVDLSGLGPLFSGEYYVTECRYLFDATSGLRTVFTVERPGIGRV